MTCQDIVDHALIVIENIKSKKRQVYITINYDTGRVYESIMTDGSAMHSNYRFKK